MRGRGRSAGRPARDGDGDVLREREGQHYEAAVVDVLSFTDTQTETVVTRTETKTGTQVVVLFPSIVVHS